MRRLVSLFGIGLLACVLAACGTDSVARSVGRNTATQTPTPGKVEVKIENLFNYRQEGNSVYFVGEVVNVGQTDAGNIEVVVSLLGDNGQTLAVSSGGGSGQGRPILKPGERTYFQVSVREAPQSWKEERAQVQAGNPSTSTRERTYFDLQSEGVNCAPSGRSTGGLACTGQIVNGGSATAKNVQVVIAAYDGSGKLVDVGTGYAEFSEIAAGQSSPFQLRMIGMKETPARIEVQVVGRQDR